MPADRRGFTVVLRMDPQGNVTGSFKSANTDATGEGKFDPAAKVVTLGIETERGGLDVTGTITGTDMSGSVDFGGGAFSTTFTAKRTGDAPAVTQAQTATTPVKPPGESLEKLLPGPRWVSSIEASRFRRGCVYMTCDGHRSNDDKPYVFVSEDYGVTWRSLVNNLPDTAGSTHVIREDIKNENVLYLGTEFAIFVSVDRGQSWTKLNSNLPTVAVHEVALHPTAGELVAATHGRSLWILDVAALRQITPATLVADAYLYRPQPAVKWRSKPSRGSSGTRRVRGPEPAERRGDLLLAGQRRRCGRAENHRHRRPGTHGDRRRDEGRPAPHRVGSAALRHPRSATLRKVPHADHDSDAVAVCPAVSTC